jgi:hypothetical protein
MKINNFIILLAMTAMTCTLTACDQSSHGGNGDNFTLTTLSSSTNSGSVYDNFTNGPRYQALQLTNNSSSTLTISTLSITNSDQPVLIVPSTDNNVYNGNTPCVANSTSLAPNQSCYIFLHADPNYADLFNNPNPTPGPFTQTLTVGTNLGSASMQVQSQGYIYFGGDFTQLGQAKITSGPNKLLAKCSFANSNSQSLPVRMRSAAVLLLVLITASTV